MDGKTQTLTTKTVYNLYTAVGILVTATQNTVKYKTKLQIKYIYVDDISVNFHKS